MLQWVPDLGGLNEVTRFVLLAVLVGLLSKWFLYKRSRRKYNLPPMVKEGWPLLGYWPYLGSKPHVELFHLRQVYGNVYRIKIGTQEAVVLNDYNSAKEMLMKDAFLGRPPNIPQQLYREDPSLADANYQEWRDQRRYSLTVLRDFGFGRSRMDQFIQEEVKFFMQEMDKKEGKPVALLLPLACAVCNVILVLIAGRRFDYDVIHRELLPDYFRTCLTVVSQTTQLFFSRWQKFFYDIRLFTHGKLHDLFDLLYTFIKREIKEHKETLDNHHMRDYIDGYLHRMDTEQTKNKTTSFNDASMRANTQLWFTAAADTVTATLEWSLLIMIRYPEIQKRVQSEIDDIIGRERQPCWEDRKNMPYIQAVIQEIQRYRTLLPINNTRMALVDDTIQGYDIPRGMPIFVNLWAVHFDHDYWNDPEAFRPDRFLHQNGTVYQKSDHVIPFTVGKRNCPGETLANVTIFIFFATLLQRYNVKLPEGVSHTMDGKLGMLHYPTPYDICFQVRS